MLRATLAIAGFILCVSTNLAFGRGRALIIGIGEYEKAMRLDFVENDVANLATALSDRCGYEVTHVHDTAIEGRLDAIGPTTHRDALMRKIEKWISSIQANDHAVIYFSGHGFLAPDGRLYLAVINCDPKNPEPGGVPIAWLREKLNQCDASRKVLFLDACHAGAVRGTKSLSVSAKALAVEFADLKDVITFASSQSDESSYLWPLKKQSLFSFWLTQGAQGHADFDSDGKVTFRELTDFVTDNVASVAGSMLGKQQTPVIVGDRSLEDALSLQIKPLPLKRLISDMADQIDTQLRCESFPAVGVVPSFTCGEMGTNINLDFGTLPAFIAAKLRRELVVKSRRAYRLISENAMREVLNQSNAGAGDIGASKTTELVLTKESAEISVPALVSGKIHSREGAILRLSVSLFDARHKSEVASASGTAYLNESERAMIPDSMSRPGNPANQTLVSNALRIDTDSPEAAVPPEIVHQIEQADQKAKQPHPLSDPSFPYRLEVRVKDANGRYRKRTPRFEGNRCFVELNRGEVYGLWVENRTNASVFLKLLVDGQNTLPQTTGFNEKGLVVEATSRVGTRASAPRVSLEEARSWHMDPRAVNAIRGFFGDQAESDQGGKMIRREFKIVDSEDSAAGRQGFVENIGLITAAFYRETVEGQDESSIEETERGIGTGFGEEAEVEVESFGGDAVPGECLAVLHIRYHE